ncbi:hypothetical protein [Jeotgalicoccus sp. WY2]|nr:hypothetical protein [Jeotgalicoccus sp. WY2]
MIDYYYEHKSNGTETVDNSNNQVVQRIYKLLKKYADGYEH